MLLVIGLLAACLGICTRVSTRIGFASLLASQAWLYAFAQCVGSEAFGHLFGLLAITSAIVWMRRQSSEKLIDGMLLLALASAVLARHINLLLILVAPGWCCCNLLVALARGGSERRTLCLRLLRRFLRASVIGILAPGTAYLVTLACCSFYHVPYRSRVGYVFQWRLNVFVSPTTSIRQWRNVRKCLNDERRKPKRAV